MEQNGDRATVTIYCDPPVDVPWCTLVRDLLFLIVFAGVQRMQRLLLPTLRPNVQRANEPTCLSETERSAGRVGLMRFCRGYDFAPIGLKNKFSTIVFPFRNQFRTFGDGQTLIRPATGWVKNAIDHFSFRRTDFLFCFVRIACIVPAHEKAEQNMRKLSPIRIV